MTDNQYYTETTQHLTVTADRIAYAGRPGSTKDLFAVFLDGQHEMNVGPRNSFGLKPGMDVDVKVLRHAYSGILQIQPA